MNWITLAQIRKCYLFIIDTQNKRRLDFHSQHVHDNEMLWNQRSYLYAAHGCCDSPKLEPLEGWKDGARATSRPHSYVESLIGSGVKIFIILLTLRNNVLPLKSNSLGDDEGRAMRTSLCLCAHNEMLSIRSALWQTFISSVLRLRDLRRWSSSAEASAWMCFTTFTVCDLTAAKQTSASRRNPTTTTIRLATPLPTLRHKQILCVTEEVVQDSILSMPHKQHVACFSLHLPVLFHFANPAKRQYLPYSWWCWV